MRNDGRVWWMDKRVMETLVWRSNAAVADHQYEGCIISNCSSSETQEDCPKFITKREKSLAPILCSLTAHFLPSVTTT
jgi:hypothetical protein